MEIKAVQILLSVIEREAENVRLEIVSANRSALFRAYFGNYQQEALQYRGEARVRYNAFHSVCKTTNRAFAQMRRDKAISREQFAYCQKKLRDFRQSVYHCYLCESLDKAIDFIPY